MAEINVPGIGGVDRRVVFGIAGAGAAFILWRYWRAAGDAPDAGEVVEDVTDADGILTDGGYGVGTYQGSAITGNLDVDATSPGVPSTDAEWVTESVEDLSAYGVDPAFAALALGKWLAGEGLTAQEKELVIQARAMTGNPPVAGALPIKTANPGGTGTTPKPDPKPTPGPKPPTKPKPGPVKPAPKPKPKPPASAKYVRVRPGDNLTKIATRNKTTLSRLRGFPQNAKYFTEARRKGDLIFPGERVRVA